MYRWQLAHDLAVPVLNDELPTVHTTRAELAEPVARAALQAAGSNARALDVASHEGWFAHRLLEWGAREVVAVDIRDVNVRRAKLLRDHFGIPAETLRVEQANVYDLSAETIGRFDVVLMLGLIYHLENPIGALRVARDLTRGVCLVESQLTRQRDPIRTGWGVSDEFHEEPASWAAKYEDPDEQEHQPLAAYGGVISLIPNEAAVLQAMDVVGFERVERLEARAAHNPQYRGGDRALFAGYV
jgi:tRNA (mo5U34)-methyltransferase